ncbi:MAG: FecR domain-containing protein, partial [Ferruginibacter sp.]
YYRMDKAKAKLAFASPYGEEVLAGAKKATLVLSNGSSLLLQGSVDSLFNEGGSAIQRNANGSLVYTGREPGRETSWNTLHIPNGGEYMIVLEDGSKVWLNAASSLRYPVQFTGRERRVELLEGEAYFEIAKNKERPFIVMANRMEVQAIGTAFNVNTYGNADSLVSTTLTEGKVSVQTRESRYMLEAGQQVRLNKAGPVVADADVDAVTGWKNGLFVFNNAPLWEVMVQLARWYDVHVAYDPRFKEQQFFTGEIKRNVPLSELLQMLELTGIARFKIHDGTILIQPYREP